MNFFCITEVQNWTDHLKTVTCWSMSTIYLYMSTHMLHVLHIQHLVFFSKLLYPCRGFTLSEISVPSNLQKKKKKFSQPPIVWSYNTTLTPTNNRKFNLTYIKVYYHLEAYNMFKRWIIYINDTYPLVK